jgi:tetratricopeptide (TPR) repeat protein
MGGWVVEEIFWSKFRIAYIMKLLGLADNVVIAGFQDAIAYRPHRAEPYYYLAEFLYNRKDYQAAYDMIQDYFQVKQPVVRDYLFNANWIREYGMLFQLSLCSYYLGNYEESLAACDQLLANKELPADWRSLVTSNRKFCVDKIDL